jgi:hypothetical protein
LHTTADCHWCCKNSSAIHRRASDLNDTAGTGQPATCLRTTFVSFSRRGSIETHAHPATAGSRRFHRDRAARTSLFINIGSTTTEAVARTMLQHSGLMVITNNLNVASLMRNRAVSLG